jgi:hypothetical protein
MPWDATRLKVATLDADGGAAPSSEVLAYVAGPPPRARSRAAPPPTLAPVAVCVCVCERESCEAGLTSSLYTVVELEAHITEL